MCIYITVIMNSVDIAYRMAAEVDAYVCKSVAITSGFVTIANENV